MPYIYKVEYYSAIKRMKQCHLQPTWMDLEIIILSEVCQTEKDIIWFHMYVESKKNNTNELAYKTDSQISKASLSL